LAWRQHKTLLTFNDTQRFGDKLFNDSLHVGSFLAATTQRNTVSALFMEELSLLPNQSLLSSGF